mmetsp:Transcript_5152/g.7891  ORF Transcript_5152/g.7891 Transcript_5152/m.7891 type:complete len:411 (-) Transcript_5152:122-1354(-)
MRCLLISLLWFASYQYVSGACPFKHHTTTSSSHRQLNEESTPVEGSIPMSTDQSDPLVQTNDYFHSMYSTARQEVLPKVNIMVEGDYLVLHLSNGSRIVEPIVHDIFHNLKMVSHLPLGAYSILLPNTSHAINLDDETVENMARYMELLENVTITSDRFPDPVQLERQITIYNITVDFVLRILSTQQCSLDLLADFAWSTSSYVNSNLDDAAEDNVNTTHGVVMRWKENILSDAEWDELYAVSAVGHMVAQEHGLHQYFARLFNVSVADGCGENQGYTFYESKAFTLGGHYPTEEMISQDVGTHYTDFPIGQHFFHDLYRMHRDALADGARKAVDKIFGPQETSEPEDIPYDTGSDDDEVHLYWKYIAMSSLVALGFAMVGLAVQLKRLNSAKAILEGAHFSSSKNALHS